MATRIAEDGYLEAGYDQVSIDDCWPNMERDSETNRFVGNTSRFPNGIKSLGDFMHSKNVRFGIYSDEGTKTCGGYPGSKGYEKIDAETFKDWGVDYLKLDGCYNNERYVFFSFISSQIPPPPPPPQQQQQWLRDWVSDVRIGLAKFRKRYCLFLFMACLPW